MAAMAAVGGPPQDRCVVFRDSKVNWLVAEGEKHQARLEAQRRTNPRRPAPDPAEECPRAAPRDAETADKAKNKARLRECLLMYQEDNATRRQMAERRHRDKLARQHALFESTLSAVIDGLQGRNAVIASVDATLSEHDARSRKRREALFKDWEGSVFDAIQLQIGRSLAACEGKDINARKRLLFDEFLAADRSKLGLFRDTIIESDYDPLKARAQAIRYDRPSRIDDPTKRDWAKRAAELAQHGLDCPDGSTSPRNKAMLSLLLWDKLSSTPYGHDAHLYDEAGNVVQVPKRLLRPPSGIKRVILDDYNIVKGQEVTLAEFPRTKGMSARHRPDSDIFAICEG